MFIIIVYKKNILIVILTNFDNFVYAGLMVDIDMADALTVTQHRNAFSSPLDISDQLRRTTGND